MSVKVSSLNRGFTEYQILSVCCAPERANLFHLLFAWRSPLTGALFGASNLCDNFALARAMAR